MGATTPKRILIVEDQDAVREVYTELLRDVGYSVLEARLAKDAEEMLRKDRPDILLLDLNMPSGTMSGAELLARLRESMTFASLPVIIVSGLGDLLNPDVVEGLHVTAVLQKPVGREDLLRVVREAARAQ